MARLSTYELEETVATMVKSSQTTPHKIVKPSWWPSDFQFPLKRYPGMHPRNWREILHNLISKCYQFDNRERLRSKRLKHSVHLEKHNFRRNSGSECSSTDGRATKTHESKSKIVARMRHDSTGSSADSSISSHSGGGAVTLVKKTTEKETGLCSEMALASSGDGATSHCEVSVAEVLAKNLGLAQSEKFPNRIVSPVVQVYDVCKFNNNNHLKYSKQANCDVKRDINVEKSDFMSYFRLNSENVNIPPKKETLQSTVTKTTTHKNNLVNCPHVPFSSNIGLKLIKEWHNYDADVIEKRLERLERYLCNSDLPSLMTPINDEFQVLNNKNSDARAPIGHFYIFPTKRRHRKDKLTPKARYLLKKYCKPCFVNLSASGDDKIKKYLRNRKQKIIAVIDLTKDNDKQKENKTPFTLLESRVVLTPIEKLKKNFPTSTSFVKTSDRSNFALQTLALRNENAVATTTKTKLVNFINPSVVLQPIHELFEFTKRDKILHTAHKIARLPHRVVKTRVNVYNPRRFSTRLQEVINV